MAFSYTFLLNVSNEDDANRALATAFRLDFDGAALLAGFTVFVPGMEYSISSDETVNTEFAKYQSVVVATIASKPEYTTMLWWNDFPRSVYVNMQSAYNAPDDTIRV